MGLMMRFMSKKMQRRILLLKDNWAGVAEELGAECVPEGFGAAGGTATPGVFGVDPALGGVAAGVTAGSDGAESKEEGGGAVGAAAD